MSKAKADAEIRCPGICCASAPAVCFAQHLTQGSPNGHAAPSSLMMSQLHNILLMDPILFQTCTGRSSRQAQFRRSSSSATASSANPISRVPAGGQDCRSRRRLAPLRSEVRLPASVGGGSGCCGRRGGETAAATATAATTTSSVSSGPPFCRSAPSSPAAAHGQTPFVHSVGPGFGESWRRLAEVVRPVAGLAR